MTETKTYYAGRSGFTRHYGPAKVEVDPSSDGSYWWIDCDNWSKPITPAGSEPTRDEIAAAMAEEDYVLLDEYAYGTDAEVGTFYAIDFAHAQQQLKAELTYDKLANGAWGWVENLDGERFWVGRRP